MNALDEVASIGADLRAWLEWQEALGAAALPKETVVAAPAVDDIQPRRVSRPVKKAVPRAPDPSATKMVGRVQPVQEKQVKPEAPNKPAVLSDKWKALMDGPTTHRVQGPTGAALLIVRGLGSSAEAEAMLRRLGVSDAPPAAESAAPSSSPDEPVPVSTLTFSSASLVIRTAV